MSGLDETGAAAASAAVPVLDAISDEHTFNLLDFPRVREGLAEYCLSPEGAAMLKDGYPLRQAAPLRALKIEIAALVDELRDREFTGAAFPDAASARRTLTKDGAVLEIPELYSLGIWAKAYASFFSWLRACAFLRSPECSTRPVPAKKPVSAERLAPPHSAVAAPPHNTTAAPLPRGTAWADESLADILSCAPSMENVAQAVFAVLDAHGELRDLPPLRKIRLSIQKADRDLRSLSDSYFRDPDLKAALQSGEPTLRDGRTVLAVRANFRGRVKGIVHEVSATGQTVFIEPEALVVKNNELVQLESAYRIEVAKILRETSAALHAYSDAIATAAHCVALADGRMARALAALREGKVFALDLEKGFFIRKGRHPLLGKKAVPIDVELPEETRTLIITGPNTGGKTVTLKTIGLFALMNQFCMALPAASETGFSVFDSVWADIGDEQSIDQSLSTFSGHMRVLGRIVAHASADSLVLLDELGAGTDPEEGCAVAMGLLDHFIERGSLTVLTTHHGILKNFGYTRPGCLNASMDFDAKSLSPTYRILMGVPGESHALDIASKNGLPVSVVEAARAYLRDERTDVSELIRGLNEKHHTLAQIERERARRLKAATEGQRKADLAALRVKRQEVALRQKGLADLQKLLSESGKTLENLVRELRESGAQGLQTKEVKGFLADLSGAVLAQRRLLKESQAEIAAAEVLTPSVAADMPGSGCPVDDTFSDELPSRPLAQGDRVFVGPARRQGTIVRASGKGKWLVEVNAMRLSVAEKDLRLGPVSAQGTKGLATKAGPGGTGGTSSSSSTSSSGGTGGTDIQSPPHYSVELAPRDQADGAARGSAIRAAFELDLRGFRLVEALAALERQVDAAALQGLSLFSIIHGTGEGILGPGIHDYLHGNPAVASYHFARPEEGGYGKTIVRLK